MLVNTRHIHFFLYLSISIFSCSVWVHGRALLVSCACEWHGVESCQVYLNQIPVHVEGLFVPSDAGEPAQKRRRVEMEHRRNQSSSQLANSLGQRCLFVFWGWSTRLQINHGWKHQSPTDQRLLRSKGMRSAAGVFFQKLQAQASNLRAKLPSNQTLWLSGLPSLSDRRAMATIAASIEQTWANTEIPNPAKELQWQTSRATVIAILPMALPGMGKSSLLEALFRRCQSGGSKCYRQGKLLGTSNSPCANSGSLPRPASAAIVSSTLALLTGPPGNPLLTRYFYPFQFPMEQW